MRLASVLQPRPRVRDGADVMEAFTEHVLFDRYRFLSGQLPHDLARQGRERFEELWELRPAEFHRVSQPFTGKSIPLPRWQQAYGRDYRYTGSVNVALPIPPSLELYLAWARKQFDARLNGLLLNWYDATQRHYIGSHRDSTSGLVEGIPIVTISLGANRAFRLRPLRGKDVADFEAGHGAVFVLPWETNLRLKHEVPHRARNSGRRISITVRAFADRGSSDVPRNARTRS
jgi:alkylated DNA repair dioxygenase AlkB